MTTAMNQNGKVAESQATEQGASSQTKFKRSAKQSRRADPTSPAKRAPWTNQPSAIEPNGVRYNPGQYCGNGLPKLPLPHGYFLVHNHVGPAKPLGMNGFRAWVQKGRASKLVECKCDFAGMKNAKVNRHYRVKFE